MPEGPATLFDAAARNYRAAALSGGAVMDEADMAKVKAWVKADRDLIGVWSSCEQREPTRVIVDVDGLTEVVELSRDLVEGRQVVVARRLRVHGV